ncbi:Resolvase/integrase Bin (plasmid) [Rhodococcus sp. WAY2]|nr:Resolvase/integrase Bin [Rhodococcus sp. WAY2]
MSTSKQDLTRQIDALRKTGVDQANIYVDKKSGATTERPGLQALLGYRPQGRRDRGAHPRPARPHRPRHPQPDPRPAPAASACGIANHS